MMTKKKWLLLLALGGVAIATKLASLNPVLIENWYTNAVYLHISGLLKTMLGWLPFSIGDIIYGFLIGWLLVKAVKLIKMIVKKEVEYSAFYTIIYNATLSLFIIYVLFNVLWGLNYNRLGIKHQLMLNPGKYSVEELAEMDSLLVEKVNATKLAVIRQNKMLKGNKAIFEGAVNAYNNVSKKYPYLAYATPSIKPSLWGWAGNYFGFTGYYNPFTGEAQVNTTVPPFLIPYTTCHEVAHQLGYAKEDEANFVGYLAAITSEDTAFHYSAYLDLFLYTQSNLYNADSAKAKYYYKKLIPPVNDDLQELKKFFQSHKSPAGPLFRWIYRIYLENNQQPSGLLSYDEVTGFLIAYYKKTGRI